MLFVCLFEVVHERDTSHTNGKSGHLHLLTKFTSTTFNKKGSTSSKFDILGSKHFEMYLILLLLLQYATAISHEVLNFPCLSRTFVL